MIPTMLKTVDLNIAEIKRFYVNGNESRRSKSGILYLAKCRDGRQFIIKHHFPHLAASEYLYHRLAKKIGLISPHVELIDYESLNEKVKSIMYSPFIVAIEYLDIEKKRLNIADLHSADTHAQYYSHKAMDCVFRDRNSFDIVLATGSGRLIDRVTSIYRLGVSESFFLPTDLSTEKFIEQKDNTEYWYTQMNSTTKQWDNDYLAMVVNEYKNSLKVVVDKKLRNGGEDVEDELHRMRVYRDTFSELKNLSKDTYWNLCTDLRTCYSKSIQEMFMLYFLRSTEFLGNLSEAIFEIAQEQHNRLRRNKK